MMVCDACRREARLVTVDFGIGAYEYWGATGFHRDEHEVTECCEADLVDLFEPNPDELNESEVA